MSAETAPDPEDEQPKQQVRDPNGVVSDAAGEANTASIERFRDPEPQAGETGSQYTSRVRGMREAHGRGEAAPDAETTLTAPPVAQVADGQTRAVTDDDREAGFGNEGAAKAAADRAANPKAAGDPTDPTPLTGVRVGQDPLGISTGRTVQTPIESEGSAPAAEPGVRSDEDEAARIAEQGGEAEGEGDNTSSKKGKLPEDFPGRAALEAEGITTYGAVRKARDRGTLTDIAGIGDATAKKIEGEL